MTTFSNKCLLSRLQKQQAQVKSIINVTVKCSKCPLSAFTQARRRFLKLAVDLWILSCDKSFLYMPTCIYSLLFRTLEQILIFEKKSRFIIIFWTTIFVFQFFKLFIDAINKSLFYIISYPQAETRTRAGNSDSNRDSSRYFGSCDLLATCSYWFETWSQTCGLRVLTSFTVGRLIFSWMHGNSIVLTFKLII